MFESKVVYFLGDPNLADESQSGVMTVSSKGLRIVGKREVTIPFTTVVDVSLEKFSPGTMVNISLDHGAIAMFVPRINIGGGQFILANPFATKKLCQAIQDEIVASKSTI